ncbi:IS110 family transposase, partial [Bradyrhizobium sp. SSUT112]|nr:IS110 family transposase [Bradyrhizobium sp. SSUT112]
MRSFWSTRGYAKNVPGRKTDLGDAAWLRQLHSMASYGAASDPMPRSQPCEPICGQRERFAEYAAAHIQHMQKALMEMNLQLHHAVSDITGAT